MNLWNKSFKPMLLSETNKPFNSNKYLFEIKYDGVRVLIYVSPKSIKIINRNLNDMTYLFPELKFIKDKVRGKVIFDGEIIAVENSMPSFSKLQKRIHLKSNNIIKKESISNPVTFIAFDILYNNKDLTKLPLIIRKEYLNKYEDDDLFIKSMYIKEKGITLFKKIKKLGLEGIVAKKINGRYYIDQRCDEWTKIKNFKCEEFYIGGYRIKKSNYVISVLLGEYKNNKLYYVGNVSLSKNNKIYLKIINSKISANPFIDYYENENFINPVYKIGVFYIERTPNNHLRQPFIKK